MPYETQDRTEVADKWFPVEVQGIRERGKGLVFGQSARPGPCFYLYRSIVINPDGGVSPCCVVYRKTRDFADLKGKEIDPWAIWNNPKYLSARSLFSQEKINSRKITICDSCDLFAVHPSKERIKDIHT
jgi:hypothetical protein